MKVFYILLFIATTCTFIFFSQLFNPNFVHAVDRLYFLAPCCHNVGNSSIQNDRSFEVSNLSAVDAMMWYLARFMMQIAKGLNSSDVQDSDQACCDLCEVYQKARCHVRVGRLTLPRLNLWNKAKLSNVRIRSSDKCIIGKNRLVGDSIVSMWDIFPLYLLQGNLGFGGNSLEHEFIRHSDIVNVGGYEYGGARVRGSSALMSSLSYPPPSAIEIGELSLDIGSIQKPIVNINATNITVNLVFSIDKLIIASNLEVSMPSIKVGDWTLDELIALIPDPPETVGLYPRLGSVNLTDVTVIINDERDDDKKQETTAKIFHLPDELFLPLLLLTQKASEKSGVGEVNGGGIDRTEIQDVIRESAIVAFRKYILGEDTILKTMQKPAEFIDTLRTMMESLHHGKDQIIEHHWSKVRGFLSEIEQSWNDAIHDQNGQFYKITNDLLGGWHSFKDLIADSVADTEANLSLFLEHVEEEAEQVRRDMEILVEGGLHVAKQMELELEHLIEDTLNDAKGRMHQFFTDKIEQMYDEEF